MKKILALLSFLITILVIAISGLYSYTSALCILFNTIVVSVFIGYGKSNLVFQAALLLSIMCFEVLLLIGIQQTNLPVNEQSLMLPVLMMIFILTQLGVSVFGLIKILLRDKFKIKFLEIIALVIITVVVGIYLTLRINMYIYIAFAVIVVFFVLSILKTNNNNQ